MKNWINLIPILILILFTSSHKIYAQNDRTESNLAYKQKFKLNTPQSYLTTPFGDMHWRPDFTYYILTADVAPHFFLFTEGNTPFAFDLFTDINIRIMTGTSLPVRTPSYQAGGTGYLRSNFLKNKNHFDYFTLKFVHHSNGQDGCPLYGYERDSTDICLQTDFFNPDLKIFNQNNGNFGTNYLEFGFNISLQKLESTTKTFGYFLFRHPISKFIGDKYDYFYIGYQHHITGIEPELKGRYGLSRLILKYQRITSANWLNSAVNKFEADRLITNLSINLSSMDRFEGFKFINRFNFDFKYNFTIRGLSTNTTALFVMAGYKGQDNYNIFLEDNYTYVGFGISVGNILYTTKR